MTTTRQKLHENLIDVINNFYKYYNNASSMPTTKVLRSDCGVDRS